MQAAPQVASIDRLLGKSGFAQTVRTATRSVFHHAFRWITRARLAGRRRIPWDMRVWQEVLMSLILLLLNQMDLAADFCPRVEVTDASMTGLGRAWGYLPESVVRDMCRLSDGRGSYTNLSLPGGVVVENGFCPLQKVRWPVDQVSWRVASAAAVPAHITLGEADAANWALEERLSRPRARGCRVLRDEDSAAVVGAFSKGRSRS